MFIILFFFVLFALPSGVLLCLCSLLAVWLAFGKTQIFLRMPLFLLATVPLGLVLCLAESSRHACQIYLFGALLIAASLPRTHFALQIPPFLAGASYIAYLPYQLRSESLDSSWIVRVTAAICFVAFVVSMMRWIGYRLVDLTDGVSGDELDRGTGRDLDGWIGYLDRAGRANLNHAETMALLREYGLSFEWQKTITVAYQKALGRRAIGHTAIRRHEVVVDQPDRALTNWSAHLPQQQFSIWQMMVATFCVASLLGFARTFAWSMPGSLDWKYGVPIATGVAATTLAAVNACLAIRDVRQKLLFAILAAVVASIGVPLSMGFRSFANPWVSLFPLTMLVHSGLVIGVLMRARYHGYRLVRVVAKEQLKLEAVNAVP